MIYLKDLFKKYLLKNIYLINFTCNKNIFFKKNYLKNSFKKYI